MKIDLKTLKTHWINMSTQVEKHNRMLSMFNNLGMKNTEHFEGIKLDPNSHIKDGSGMATHTLLTKIIKENSFPCLILEDDAKETKCYIDTFDVPDECDALYLGISKAGSKGQPCQATVYNDNYFRVWNMLATHAVIYFNKNYAQKIVDNGKFLLENNIPYDIGIGDIHDEFTILTTEYPIFYQYDPDKSSKFDVEWYTKYQLTPLPEKIQKVNFKSGSKIIDLLKN
jgi:hypothetical protein